MMYENIIEAAAIHALMSQRRDFARTARHKRTGGILVNSAVAANDKTDIEFLVVRLHTYYSPWKKGGVACGGTETWMRCMD